MHIYKENKPIISVAMGVCYRRGNTQLLERAIKSILAQSFFEFEFLICENGSNEMAKEIIEKLALEDPRIKIIDGEGAFKLSEKLNRCIYHASGIFIARMDDDDFSEPLRFEKQIKFLEYNPEISFVGSNVKLYQDGKYVGVRLFPERPQTKDFLFVQPFIHPSVIFRKDNLLDIGGYCEHNYCDGCEDYDLFLRMYKAGYYGANLQEPIFDYTIQSVGTTNRSFVMRVNEVRTRYKRFFELGFLPKKILYVIKPIVVGLIPIRLVSKIKAILGDRM